jgi:tRNA modification GTPase
VTLLDTAGIRDSADPVEQEGVHRARARASEADLILWVQDANDLAARSGAQRDIPSEFLRSVTWIVRNKIDLTDLRNERRNEGEYKNIIIDVSALTAVGLQDLLSKMANFAKSYFGSDSALLTRERHKRALLSARDALDSALAATESKGEEVLAEDIRSACHALGRLTGRVDVEDLLDVIFQEFCIGK